ncbi:hypothetical protein [Granulicella sp. L46]|uniref:hypothetical protein n=1 Tax=Granulicella sp. L46 TaxID=1641865 RepID=UPI00131CFBBD|nr:hypothetical protein [Granulicella sp. L46]
MKMKETQKRLNRILRDLDNAAGFFEKLGLTAQTALLDEAADAVEATRHVAKDLRGCCA